MKSASWLALTPVLIAALASTPPARSQSPDMESAARGFIASLAKEDFTGAVAQFDARMQAALPEAKLHEVWRSLQAQAGPFKRATLARMEKQDGFDIVFVTCEFERIALDAKVVFTRAGQITGLFFVPAAKLAPSEMPAAGPPKNVAEQAMTVGAGEWALPGTLSLPVDGRQTALPAIVLVHGSGPGDRDETVGANKPFRDLAWGLAAKGIAMLRYEKRTKVYAAKLSALREFTVKEETIDDALAAVALLRATAGIDGARVFVLGHSLGGTLAPRIARADPGISGVIILAGSTRPMEDLMIEQMRYLYALDGAVSADEQAKLDVLQAKVDRVKKLTPADASSSVSVLGAPASYWIDLRAYDAPVVARELKQRMLILQGGRDYQVTAMDFDGWRKALGSSDRVTLKLYPKLNHLFIAGEGRSTPAEYAQPGHVAPEVIEDIAAWILRD